MTARLDPEQFYDALASEYHLLFGDWWRAAQWHGQVIAGILARQGITGGRLLDCTCGIGTQALPLASLGYEVTATDISGAAVTRAGAEAAARGIAVGLGISHGSAQVWTWAEDAGHVDIELFTFAEEAPGA